MPRTVTWLHRVLTIRRNNKNHSWIVPQIVPRNRTKTSEIVPRFWGGFCTICGTIWGTINCTKICSMKFPWQTGPKTGQKCRNIGLSENGRNKKVLRTDSKVLRPRKVLFKKTRFSTPEIDYHGIRWYITGQIVAQWRHPMAYRVALDLPYWMVCSASHRRIIMTIDMTR